MRPSRVMPSLTRTWRFRPTAVGEEGLLAALQQAHRAARGARQQAADDLEIERFGAMAEAAADEGLDDADVRRLHLHAAASVRCT
jgi:hypothetical protein